MGVYKFFALLVLFLAAYTLCFSYIGFSIGGPQGMRAWQLASLLLWFLFLGAMYWIGAVDKFIDWLKF